jgi:hypothetical protein
MWDSSVPVLKNLLDVKTLLSLGGGLTVVSRFVGLPKVGALRAATVYLKSIFASVSPISVRSKEMKHLIMKIENLGRGHYLVVTGGKGVGKSCLVDSVLNQKPGVIKISVSFDYSINFLICYILYYFYFDCLLLFRLNRANLRVQLWTKQCGKSPTFACLTLVFWGV